MNDVELHPADKLGQWPSDGLEDVTGCPVCSSTKRETLHEDIEDWSFRCAPGRWTIKRCFACRSAYLDPRPTEQTIALAYGRYYTHDEEKAARSQTMFQLLSAALGNDYRNARYLTHLKPALVGGRWLAKLVPTLTAGADLGYRYLPKPKPGRPPRVLDVGCGSGAWLQVARNAGWQAFGCEPDESSARLARLNGIEVRPFVSDWRDNLESFDAVTSSHSIEHVYDPAAMLLDAHRLLKSGGLLFVQTPNIDAVGHDLYGRYWRGLEAPRHLVLFNRDSLAELITRAGFVDVRLRRAPSALQLMALESRRMANGLDPRGNELPSLPPAPSVKDRVRSRYDTKKVEWLSFTARKAG